MLGAMIMTQLASMLFGGGSFRQSMATFELCHALSLKCPRVVLFLPLLLFVLLPLPLSIVLGRGALNLVLGALHPSHYWLAGICGNEIQVGDSCDTPSQGLNRINRILIQTSCNFFSGSRSPKNSEVKRAWSREIWGWVTDREVLSVCA